jgi:hypothetical protein
VLGIHAKKVFQSSLTPLVDRSTDVTFFTDCHWAYDHDLFSIKLEHNYLTFASFSIRLYTLMLMHFFLFL